MRYILALLLVAACGSTSSTNSATPTPAPAPAPVPAQGGAETPVEAQPSPAWGNVEIGVVRSTDDPAGRRFAGFRGAPPLPRQTPADASTDRRRGTGYD